MAKQTSSKSSDGATPGAAKKKRTSEAPAPAAVTKTILKADSVTVTKDHIVKSEPKTGPTHEQIAQRAFELYQQRAWYEDGALNDWLSAERELRA
jgi:hypothetical protein